MTLSAICVEFQNGVEALDAGACDCAAQLGGLTRKLARDAAAEFADYGLGEIPALLQRCHEVLAWLQAEAQDTSDRQRRYARQQVVLSLLTLCEGVARFHTGKRKAADVAAFRVQIADALRGLAS